ncbi:MAG: hypothetical protein MUE52_03780 [Tabrizicola sp.]|jgi:hypothetical protein|nr:hypothetical protein [Tabrizicola sp.]
MTELALTQTRILKGVWEGVLSGVTGEPPAVEATWQGQPLDGVEISAMPGRAGWHLVRLPIPATILNEGVQTVLLQAGGKVLAQVTIIAGVPLEEDLRAEIGLLRAELDLLKRAFQRHCAETGG